jgi:plasmid stability protein
MNSYVIELSDETYDLLKEQAASHGVTMETEAKAVLETWYQKYQVCNSDKSLLSDD